MARPPVWAYGCLAAGMVFVGSYVGLSKLLLGVFPLFLLAWLRFGVAAAAMAPWLLQRKGERTLTCHQQGLLCLQALLGNVLFSVCMLMGVARTSAVSAGVMLAGIPAAVALLSRLFLGERLVLRTMAGVGCTMLGIGTLAWLGAAAPAADPTKGAGAAVGHALLLGAVFCEASYVVIGKRLTGALSARRIAAVVNLWGWVFMAPLGLWQAAGFAFHTVTPGQWAWLVYYALAASVFSVWLWMTGLARVSAARAGVYTAFLPLTAMVIGVVAFNEPFGPGQALAGGLALAGVVLATWPERPA